jgi:hypothetical protein
MTRVVHQLAECFVGCEDEQCPYVHWQSWVTLDGQHHRNEKDAERHADQLESVSTALLHEIGKTHLR